MKYCMDPPCRVLDASEKAERKRLNEKARYASKPDVVRARVAAYRLTMTPEQQEAHRTRCRERSKYRGFTESKRAAYARRRALKAGSLVQKFTNEEVFERDRWRCGICGRPIIKRLVYPHPMSVSLDHVVPLSEQGSHTRENTRAAHLSCNVRRGVGRGGADQLALIG